MEAWYHVDIQEVLKFPAEKKDRAGMNYLSGIVIDPSYAEKAKLTREEHQHWHEAPLTQALLEYAAIDGYLSYALWNRISNIKYGLDCGTASWNDSLCDSCQRGNDHKISKQNEGKPRPATINPWELEVCEDEEGDWGTWQEKKKTPTCMRCRDKEYWSAPRYTRRVREWPMQ